MAPGGWPPSRATDEGSHGRRACLAGSRGGVFLEPQWKGKIMRSTDGVKYQQVYLDDQQNTIYQSRAFAEGLVAP